MPGALTKRPTGIPGLDEITGGGRGVRDGSGTGPVPDDASAEFVLRLYVLGTTPSSAQAVANLRDVCDRELAGRHSLEVIDIYEHPERAAEDQVLAVPTLVKDSPRPSRRLIGNLSDRPRVLLALALDPA